jgi:hypothetical protein
MFAWLSFVLEFVTETDSWNQFQKSPPSCPDWRTTRSSRFRKGVLRSNRYLGFRPWRQGLRPILKFAPAPRANFTPRGKLWPQGWICPPEVNFVPWGGWSYPLGVKFSVRPSIFLNSRVCSSLGVGQILPLWAKFTPRGEVRPGGRGEVKNGFSFHLGCEMRSFAILNATDQF